MRYSITRDFTSNFLTNADFLMLYIIITCKWCYYILWLYIPFSNYFSNLSIQKFLAARRRHVLEMDFNVICEGKLSNAKAIS